MRNAIDEVKLRDFNRGLLFCIPKLEAVYAENERLRTIIAGLEARLKLAAAETVPLSKISSGVKLLSERQSASLGCSAPNRN